MSIRVGLYHGEHLLTQWSQAETKKVPFSLQPRFNQEIRLTAIRISSLPLESKLCFDIIIHSITGHR
jgi:phosphatidylinositol-4,5-bisphosphate 3-kinase catalytic subunit alpha/beta/delta